MAGDTAVAGKVLEVAGAVTVRGKQLAAGDAVAGDDVIETGPDGRAVIELAHNGAHWQLGPNKREKVTGSIAWTLPKGSGETKAVEQDTAAAGRPAERNAAETSATAPAPEAERSDKAAPGGPPPAVAEPPLPPPPPPPPPPQVQPPPPPKVARSAAIGAAGGGGAVADPLALLASHRAELVKCMGSKAAFTLHVATDGSASAAPAKPCLARVLAKIHFAAQQTDLTVDLAKLK